MGIFHKDKYEKGGIIRGTADIIKGTGELSHGVARSATGKNDYGLKYKGTKDIVKGTQKILGFKVKK
jgi:hypothetical protein